jgi:uncharacterized secreted protein with C-terminal beta-propeller domain
LQEISFHLFSKGNKMKYVSFFAALGVGLWLSVAQAWTVELRATEDGNQEIWLSSNISNRHTDVYLSHYNPDATTPFLSWHIEHGWQPGLFSVTAPNTLDFEPLPAFTPTRLPKDLCARTQDRCFLAFVAVAHGEDPTIPENWLAGNLLPLTMTAAQARIPGMTLFASEQQVRADIFSGAPAQPTETMTDNNNSADTEKPDLFRVEGSQILYANAQAQRFQVIETADLSQPRLVASLALDGQPREVYRIGAHYVLLQSSNNNEAGVQIEVLRLTDDGQLSVQESWNAPGYFLQSRRRNDILYVVSNQSSVVYSDLIWGNYSLHANVIQALRIGADGAITELEKAEVAAYDTKLAIFSDYLVVTGYAQDNWGNSLVAVFDLRDSRNPLQALPLLNVPGRIPSEFHVNVSGQYLRVVYGPSDRSSGSTLAVYDLSDNLREIGSVGGIAPGEGLFATRFHGDFAYVVTYERTDPLWVIDLSEPSQPNVRGHLEVPGWSELMFFNDGRLFAVGIDDQPSATDSWNWARRVSTSLFDVSDPDVPVKLGGFTPLQNEFSYTWSAALTDERALLLDWQDEYALLPVDSWQGEALTYVQGISLANDTLSDGGRLAVPVAVQRTAELQAGIIGVMGDQTFYTAAWGQEPQILGQLELAHNLTWLDLQADGLWTAAYGQRGYYRLYHYDPQDLSAPQQSWSVGRNYHGLVMSENSVFFHRNDPLVIQELDRASGILQPPRVLTEEKIDERHYYGTPLIHGRHVYIPATVYNIVPMFASGAGGEIMSGASLPYYYYPSQTQLHRWSLDDDSLPQVYSLPGEVLGFDGNGRLLTREHTNGKLRVNLLDLEPQQSRLRDSLEIACDTSQDNAWHDDTLYVICGARYFYYQADTYPEGDISSRLLKIDSNDGHVRVAAEWTFSSSEQPNLYLLAAKGKYVLMRRNHGYFSYYRDSTCQVFDVSDAQPRLHRELAACPSGAVALDANGVVYDAQGFAGLAILP